jgi:peptidoglycan/xylan/chitin deacetylase (PgdA/CDA1 family)
MKRGFEMSSTQKTPVAKIRKIITSVIVLMIFLLPGFLSLNWLTGVLAGADHRKVYSEQALTDFHDRRYQANVEALQPFDEPIITITFDDGWESTYSQGLPVMEKYGIKATHYILGNNFDDTNYLSKAQVRSMDAAGHEIAAHTMSHSDLTTLPGDKLDWELSEADRLLGQLLGKDIREFATPLGASNAQVTEQSKKYYRSLRNTVSDPETVGDEDINLRNFNPYNINAYTVRETTTPEDIQKLIDHTIQRKGWLILTYHQIGEKQGYWGATQDTLDKHMKLIRNSNIRPTTMGQALDAIEAAKEQKGGT